MESMPFGDGFEVEQSLFPSKTFLIICRAVWQWAIVVLYAASSQSDRGKAVYAVTAVLFIAGNILLLTRIDHFGWPEVQRRTLLAETVLVAVVELFMFGQSPLGPGVLLMLPTVAAYMWMFPPGRTQRVMVAVMALLFLDQARFWDIGRWAGPAGASGSAMILTVLYGIILLLGTLLARTLQQQSRERREFRSAMQRVREQAEQLVRVNDQIHEYAGRVYILAAAEERNRIAGEIHDTVAHRLTALLVQLQAARRILETGDKTTADGNLDVCEELARESLEEVRRSVRAIRRTPDTEGIAALRRLTLQYAALTGMVIEFAVDPTVDSLPSQMMAVLYRAIQEGLTNAQRHGRATKVDIRMSRSGAQLRLDIADNGRGSASPVPGFGLSSMRTQLRRYGGDIKVWSEPGSGFQLSLWLPVWEGESA